MEIKSRTVFYIILQFRTHISTYLKKKNLIKKEKKKRKVQGVLRIYGSVVFGQTKHFLGGLRYEFDGYVETIDVV